MIKRLSLSIAFVLLSWTACVADESTLSIMTDKGAVVFQVEMANTPKARETGLMYRKALDPQKGMLFIFDPPEIVNMWMKNTYIPLDMLFVDKAGVIQRIVSHTTPLSEAVITSPGPIYAVLEINAGMVAKAGIKAGQKITHSAFSLSK